MKHRIFIFKKNPLIHKPFAKIFFNSYTNGNRMSFICSGFPTPNQIDITNGFTSGISNEEYYNLIHLMDAMDYF